MENIISAEGVCLCGSVTVKVDKMNTDVGACHCSICRKWTGGPFMAIDCGTDVSFQGEKNISVFNSSEWAERGFCSSCGTHLFYRLKQAQQYFLPTGLFDEAIDFNFHHQVFIDEKPAYYDFANDTKNMTGPEVFAAYSQ